MRSQIDLFTLNLHALTDSTRFPMLHAKSPINDKSLSSQPRKRALIPRSSAVQRFSVAALSITLLAAPTVVLAHGGHGDEFQGGGAATQPTDAIQVDAETAKRIGLKIESVSRRSLAFSIKATGQIEASPSRKVEVTNPVGGTVVRLFVEPGDRVKVGQPVAIITSGELAGLRVEALDKQAEMTGNLQAAQADLRLAQQAHKQQQQIAATTIQQAQTEVNVAQEQYDRDKDLTQQGAIPKRQFLESQAHLAEAQKALTEAQSRLPVLESRAQLERAQSGLEAVQSRVQLSTVTYGTRLKQLGATPNADGTITIVAPISGIVADREISLGQSAQDAGAALMTIVDSRTVLATANIYEKDLEQVSNGQQVRVKVASLPNQTFSGRVAVIGSVVEGETRVIPVKAELDNSSGILKPGMFAELEMLTARTPVAGTAIPRSALVEVNGKQIVYVKNGDAYQAAEIELGRTAGDVVEVKSGLFDGDMIVTQRAAQLYAQSLRGGGKAKPEAAHAEAEILPSGGQLPWWTMVAVAGVIGAGAFWAGRRSRKELVPAYAANGHSNGAGMSHSSLLPSVSKSAETDSQTLPHHPHEEK